LGPTDECKTSKSCTLSSYPLYGRRARGWEEAKSEEEDGSAEDVDFSCLLLFRLFCYVC